MNNFNDMRIPNQWNVGLFNISLAWTVLTIVLVAADTTLQRQRTPQAQLTNTKMMVSLMPCQNEAR